MIYRDFPRSPVERVRRPQRVVTVVVVVGRPTDGRVGGDSARASGSRSSGADLEGRRLPCFLRGTFSFAKTRAATRRLPALPLAFRRLAAAAARLLRPALPLGRRVVGPKTGPYRFPRRVHINSRGGRCVRFI